MTDEILRAASMPATRFDSNEAWLAMEKRLDAGKVEQKQTVPVNRYLWITAALIISVVGIKYISTKSVTPNPLPITRSYSTTPGQRANIQLADGSQVTLGPATTLKLVQSNDSKGSITVDITGEALFTVDHSTAHPFIVTSHGVTTRVLGTQFVVRAYDASHVRVAVRAGKVSVQSPAVTDANAVAVSAGNAATITTSGIPVVAGIDDLATDFAWVDGELVLRDVPLGEALARLSRWYGMEFKVDDPSILALDVDMTFPARFSPQHLQLFADVLGASIQRSGSVVTISRRK